MTRQNRDLETHPVLAQQNTSLLSESIVSLTYTGMSSGITIHLNTINTGWWGYPENVCRDTIMEESNVAPQTTHADIYPG